MDIETVCANIIKKTEVEAQETVKEAGASYRIVCVDGEERARTFDYNDKRVNLEIENGVVVKAFIG